MKLSDIAIGTKLQLDVFDSFNREIQQNLISQFESLEDEDTIIIAAPFYEGNIYPVRSGWLVDIYFIHEDSLYKFRGQVITRSINNELSFLKVKVTSDIGKIQRRKYYRFKHSVTVHYRLHEEEKPGEEKEEKPFKKTITKDISGGGISMLLREKEFEKGALIDCRLELGSLKINFTGEVVRIGEHDREGKFKFEAGILYKIIENKDRENIIKFIFNEQRKLLKKRIL